MRQEMHPDRYRDLCPKERSLIERLLEPQFPGREVLLRQLEKSTVQILDDDGCLGFHVDSPERAAEVKYRVPTEGEFADLDGGRGHVLLHVVDGKLEELEFYKEDGSRVQAWPNPESVQVFAFE